MIRIGLISDTHSYLDDRLLELFADVDEVWHAGDIGDIRVLRALQAFKPLRAVFGNADGRDIRMELEPMLRFECGGADVLMTHIGGYPGKYSTDVRRIMCTRPPQIFVAGHSHILKVIFDRKYNSLHLNPGACGRYGIHVVRTALRFGIEAGQATQMEIIELGQRKI